MPDGCAAPRRRRLTLRTGDAEVTEVNSENLNTPQQSVDVCLCVETEAFDRLGRVIRHLAVGLIDQAVNVQVISSDPRVNSLALGPIRTVRYHSPRLNRLNRQAQEVVAAMGQRSPTIVHALGSSSYGIAARVAGHFEADLILHISSTADCRTVAEWRDESPALYIAAAEPLMQTLRTGSAAGGERTELVRPGVFVAGEVSTRLKAWTTPSILCTSHFEHGSGVDHLLWAVGRLRQRGIHALVFLLGRGRFESNLRRQVRELGLDSQVTFAAPMGDPLDAMKGADVYVRPSRDAAFHVDSLQAMGMGLATVAYPSPVTDHLHHDETAFVCEAASGEALSDALARMIGDRAYTQRLAASAREYVRQHHTISQMAERSATAYRRLALAQRTIPLPE